jgi:hypothetical protein
MSNRPIIGNTVGTGFDVDRLKNRVTSVNGKTGDVKLSANDVGALSQDELQNGVNLALQQAKDSGEFDGADGYTPVKGKDYFDGKNGNDGKTPVKGVDYFTLEDIGKIAEEASKKVDIPESGTTDYTKLENKPKINGVELDGDKTLEALGIPTGGGSDWKKIADITLEENTHSISYTFDEVKEILVMAQIKITEHQKYVFFKVNGKSCYETTNVFNNNFIVHAFYIDYRGIYPFGYCGGSKTAATLLTHRTNMLGDCYMLTGLMPDKSASSFKITINDSAIDIMAGTRIIINGR